VLKDMRLRDHARIKAYFSPEVKPPFRPSCKTAYMGIGDRIRTRRKEVGVSVSQIAAACDISVQAVYAWERGDTGSLQGKNLVAVSDLLRVTEKWLLSGRTPKEKKGSAVLNTEPGPLLRAKVPVISWTTAGTWADIQDPFPPGGAEEWVWTTKTVGPSTFALRVIGDSMEPKIPEGAIVIIDPGAPYKHGTIVLAKRTQDQTATLKQLWYDGEEPKLKPINTRYQILDMPADTRIIGVAVKLELDL
jgi:SOS-response transcriptional repressor LexA